MLLRLDSTTRYATGNFTGPLTRVAAALDPRPTTPACTSACRRRRSTAPGWRRSRPPRIRPRRNYLYFFTKPCTKRSVFATQLLPVPAPAPVDRRTHCPAEPAARSAARRARLAGRATAAPRRSRTPHWPRPGSTDWRYQLLPVPPELFAEVVPALPAAGFAGANVTIPHKAAALELSTARPPRGPGRSAPPTRWCSARGRDQRRQHRCAGAHRRAAVRGRRPDRARPRRRGQRPRRGVGVARRRGGAGPRLEPDAGAGPALAPSSGRPPPRRPAAADVLVNCTAVGLDGSEPFDRLPLTAGALGEYGCVVDLVYPRGHDAHAEAARARDPERRRAGAAHRPGRAQLRALHRRRRLAAAMRAAVARQLTAVTCPAMADDEHSDRGHSANMHALPRDGAADLRPGREPSTRSPARGADGTGDRIPGIDAQEAPAEGGAPRSKPDGADADHRRRVARPRAHVHHRGHARRPAARPQAARP